MTNFQEYVTQTRKAIQQQIDTVLKSIPPIPNLKAEYQLFSQSLEGGKTVRGTLVLLGYELAGGKKGDEIYKIAAAYEILHASLLIHDDVIDKSTTRRGKSTVYQALGANHYSISQAIGLGDMGLFLANKLIAQSLFPDNLKTQALEMISEVVVNTIVGEMLDVKLSLLDQEKKEHDVLLIHKLKTAYYTIIAPLTLGAMLNKASTQQLGAIKRFGENIGMAFQIQDDILGIFGDEKTTGKSTTSDIEENKNTLLITQAIKNATPVQKKLLLRYYGKKKITIKQHQIIKIILKKTGSLAYSKQKAQEYIHEGQKLIPSLTDDKDLQEILTQFINILINREK